MLYSSGTTGRPKGIKFPLPPADSPLGEWEIGEHSRARYGFGEDMVFLSPAPLYHAAPLRVAMAVHSVGGTVVVMERFDPALALALIERERVTHSQWVPTMFVRMLKLPQEERTRYDLSQPPGGHPRRRALPGAREGADDRVVGTDHRGVLLGDRELRQHVHHLGRVVGPQGLGRAARQQRGHPHL